MKKTNRGKREGGGGGTGRKTGGKHRQREEKNEQTDRRGFFVFHQKLTSAKDKELRLREKGVDLHFFLFFPPPSQFLGKLVCW